MTTLQHIFSFSFPFPRLLSITFNQAILAVQLISSLKEHIYATQPARHTSAPTTLPKHIHDFMKQSLGVTDEDMVMCWMALKEVGWENQEVSVTKLLPFFLEFGLPRSLGMCS